MSSKINGQKDSLHPAIPCRMIDCETHEEFKRFDSVNDLANFLGRSHCGTVLNQVLRKGGNTRGRTRYNGKWYALRPLPPSK